MRVINYNQLVPECTIAIRGKRDLVVFLLAPGTTNPAGNWFVEKELTFWRTILRELFQKSRVFLEKFSSNTTARISRTRAFSSFTPIQLSCSRPTKSKGSRGLWRCWIFDGSYPSKLIWKNWNCWGFVPQWDLNSHRQILWSDILLLNYIRKPRLVPALIRRRLPFVVLPTNYFLKNIDDIGQITKLRQWTTTP